MAELITTFLTISRRFPTTFRRFPMILQELSEGYTTVSEHFPKDCPKISRKIRRYMISVKSSISSLVRIWKIHHSSPGCDFPWILIYEWCIFQWNTRVYIFNNDYHIFVFISLHSKSYSIFREHIDNISFADEFEIHSCKLTVPKVVHQLSRVFPRSLR